MSLEYEQSFIKIGGVVFEKTCEEKQTDYHMIAQFGKNIEPNQFPDLVTI